MTTCKVMEFLIAAALLFVIAVIVGGVAAWMLGKGGYYAQIDNRRSK